MKYYYILLMMFAVSLISGYSINRHFENEDLIVIRETKKAVNDSLLLVMCLELLDNK